jgi:diguanylate cyclase (GGDEF)-like protein
VRVAIEQHKFEFEGNHIVISVSVGLAATPHPAIKAPEDLVARADKALYDAKRGGRNRLVSAL